MKPIRLTAFSHGAGCGCKLSPRVLDEILKGNEAISGDARLLVGNAGRDDAAVYDIGDGRALVSTTDFFMPIVDDPRDFGKIAAANALSDVYAMGGSPTLAISILGWPVAKLPAAIAGEVLAGARETCGQAGIALAGGHSIDSIEPIFGLAVTGLVPIPNIKRNITARPGDVIFLTKPLGAGILTTAAKKDSLRPEDRGIAVSWMTRLNALGARLGEIPAVTAMTDVTGFGLAGHLVEMCGSSLRAELGFGTLPLMTDLVPYVAAGSLPGGTARNFESYGDRLGPLTDFEKAVACDPQTSGGLLIAADPDGASAVAEVIAASAGKEFSRPVGRFVSSTDGPRVVVT